MDSIFVEDLANHGKIDDAVRVLLFVVADVLEFQVTVCVSDTMDNL